MRHDVTFQLIFSISNKNGLANLNENVSAHSKCPNIQYRIIMASLKTIEFEL